ncbi:MAG: hypothetical protein ACE5H4_09480 [Candidatus Thorarchaeota archaeon]
MKLLRIKQEYIEEISALVERLKSSISSVQVKLAALRDKETSVPQLVYSEFNFTDRKESDLSNESFDWGSLLIAMKAITPRTAEQVLRRVILDNTLKLDGLEKIRVEVQIGRDFNHIHSRNSFLPDKWALYSVILDLRHPRKDTRKALPAKLNQPFYPTLQDAISSLLETRPIFGPLEGVHIVVPDYRARIDRLHIEDNRLLLDVTLGSLSEEEIVAKIYISGEKGAEGSNDIVI